ncbi:MULTISPECIES: hypothetical protein [Micrococcales]|uniref:hypothetical protein n=1 Tax=Micrococcales TaxID=85006 RepID=UPI002493AFAC|nr:MULTISPECIES: hypothetical protein [Micrococcales]
MSDPQQPQQPAQPNQPPYGQPGPVQSPYAQPGASQGYPAPAGYPQTAGPQPGYGVAPASGPGSLGRTAFIIALITAALGLLFVIMSPIVIAGMRGQYGLYEVISLARSVLGLALGATALILGIIAARRGSQPVLAGIAIGVGGVEALGVVFSLLSNLLYGVLL